MATDTGCLIISKPENHTICKHLRKEVTAQNFTCGLVIFCKKDGSYNVKEIADEAKKYSRAMIIVTPEEDPAE